MATQISTERRAALVRITQSIRARENLPLGILAGLIGALAGAAAWATVSALTGYQIGYAAVGVGFLVGYGVRTFGSGITKPFGIAGAALSFAGCALGNLAAALAEIAKANGVAFTDVAARLDPAKLPTLMADTFQPMDLLFYAIAIYFGYKYSLRRLTKDEIAKLPA